MYSDFVTNIIYRYSLLKHEIIIIADNPFRIKKHKPENNHRQYHKHRYYYMTTYFAIFLLVDTVS